LALLWIRRDRGTALKSSPNWWGLPLVALGLGLRYVGASIYFDWLEAVSLLPVLAGFALLLGGTSGWRWCWPSIAFLFFMVPLPYSLEQALREPLRRIGTHAGTYVLQTLGFAAISEGNVIVIEDTRVGVEEACSGLRMLMIFFALSTAVALLSKRVLWERVLIVLSAVPIALVANITRISATAILHR
jgi:exosortase